MNKLSQQDQIIYGSFLATQLKKAVKNNNEILRDECCRLIQSLDPIPIRVICKRYLNIKWINSSNIDTAAEWFCNLSKPYNEFLVAMFGESKDDKWRSELIITESLDVLTGNKTIQWHAGPEEEAYYEAISNWEKENINNVKYISIEVVDVDRFEPNGIFTNPEYVVDTIKHICNFI